MSELKQIHIKLILITLIIAAMPVAALAQQSADSTGKIKQRTADTLVFSRTDSLRQVTVTAARNTLQVENYYECNQ
jgi:hypothetical protein